MRASPDPPSGSDLGGFLGVQPQGRLPDPRPARRGFGLVETLLAAAVLALAGTVVLGLIQGNRTVTERSRDDVLWDISARELINRLARYDFGRLEAQLGNHGVTASLPDLLESLGLGGAVTLPDERVPTRTWMRFDRVPGVGELGILRFAIRSQTGPVRQELARLLLADRFFAPPRVPPTGAELIAIATTPAGVTAKRVDPGTRETGGRTWHTVTIEAGDAFPFGGPGAPGTGPGSELAELDRAAARATADEMMEMLHDLYHKGEDGVAEDDLVTALRRLDEGEAGGKGSYAWDGLAADDPYGTPPAPGEAAGREGDAGALARVQSLLGSRPLPDGDYRYSVRAESEPEGGEGRDRLVLAYRLEDLATRERYLLLKAVTTLDASLETRIELEGRPGLDLGDHRVVSRRQTPLSKAVPLAGPLGHLEVTARRIYFYRPGLDPEGSPDPMERVLSIRSFAAPVFLEAGPDLAADLEPLLAAVGAGTEAMDPEVPGEDTKELLEW